jgi:Kef-type K+ transport system membrane component KefB
VKFIPIILIVFVIYTLSNAYHLPSLLFILIFGIFLNNLDELQRFRFIRRLEPAKLDSEVTRFREIVVELSFLVRTIFFLLFGFLINIRDLFDPWDILITAGIVALILVIRYFQLRAGRIATKSLLFIAPRGLVSILLYLSIPAHMRIPLVNEPLMIQVVLLSSLAMMLGSIFTKEPNEEEEPADGKPVADSSLTD